MIKEALAKIVKKGDLTFVEAYTVMSEILTGAATPVQTGAFLAALSTKNIKAESVEEITGCVTAMRELAVPVEYEGETIDISGTGGTGASSMNISTTAAIIAAAGGLKVAKQGTRDLKNSSASANLLETLGVNINQSPDKVRKLLDKVGICFLYSKLYHPNLQYVDEIRRELGIRTIYSILGSMTNPIKPVYEVLGVYSDDLCYSSAVAFRELGVKRGIVFHGLDSQDIIPVSAPTNIVEFDEKGFRNYTIEPEQFGFVRSKKEDLIGGTSEENAACTWDILKGNKGPRMDAAIMNAGVALYVGRKADSIEEGIHQAREIVESGEALKTLLHFINESK